MIRRKRGGGELDDSQISELVRGVVAGDVADYQLSALLMAICYEGLSYRETLALTRAYIASGERLDWSQFDGPIVDKHSTGGVGDKVSPLLVPWLAAVGFVIPKMSGRGLGHTGGTIDKLESIPGFSVNLGPDRLAEILQQVGCAIIAQSSALVPADKKIYALRDATDTVDELGLIAASVLSKKLAAGAHFIVLDVKCGSGAFFRTEQQAREFAAVAIRLGHDLGRPVACVVSNMDQPLGCAVGNALEIAEVDAMLHDGPRQADLFELCVALGSQLLVLCGRCADAAAGAEQMEEVWRSGAVRERFEHWIAAQGGNLADFRSRQRDLRGYRTIEVRAEGDGFIAAMDTAGIGELVRSVGAGRMKAGDTIDSQVGLLCRRKISAAVVRGDQLATIIAKAADPRGDAELADEYRNCLEIASEKPAPRQLIIATQADN
jgi:pyrimidine-nucleoside phosphorylase